MLELHIDNNYSIDLGIYRLTSKRDKTLSRCYSTVDFIIPLDGSSSQFALGLLSSVHSHALKARYI